VIFHTLSREDLRRIVDLSTESLRRMLAERQIGFELTAAARDALAAEGYDAHFGARPLKRVLQRRVQNPLAMKLLQGEFAPGQSVRVDVERGEFVFRTASR
jgi:ATP-dependent Clp protease ATP-binding subunit ClpB